MLTKISNIQKNLAILRKFCSSFVIPEGLTVSVSADGSKPTLSLHAPYSYGDETEDTLRNREAVLDLAGKWFDKTSWIQEEDYSNKYYNWSKEWYGIRLTILHAKPIPRAQNGTPVAPTEFPLLLENVES